MKSRNKNSTLCVFVFIFFLLSIAWSQPAQTPQFIVPSGHIAWKDRMQRPHYTVQIRGTNVFEKEGQQVEIYFYDRGTSYWGDGAWARITNLNADTVIFYQELGSIGTWEGAGERVYTCIIPYNRTISVELLAWGIPLVGLMEQWLYFGNEEIHGYRETTATRYFQISYSLLQPTNVQATDGYNNVTISWDYPSSFDNHTDHRGFTVYRNDGKEIRQTTTSERSISDNLTEPLPVPGKMYTYQAAVAYSGWTDASRSVGDIGFKVPNGQIGGQVRTQDQNGIEKVEVRVRPEVPDMLNTALLFDGIDDYVALEYDNSLNPSGQVTIEAWVKPEANMQTWARIFSSGRDNRLELIAMTESEQKFSIYPWINGAFRSVVDPDTWTPGQWYHVAGTYDGQVVRLYVNGILKASTNYSGSLAIYLSDPRIAWKNGALQEHFKGLIDEVRFWNVARTQNQIRTNMYRILKGNEERLVSYWRFYQSSNGIAGDYAITGGNHGLIHGASDHTADLLEFFYTDTSSGNYGDFSVTHIYYGDEADFMLIPDTTGGRIFSPATDTIPDINLYYSDNINTYQRTLEPIIDQSSFSVTGTVTAGNCAVNGVTILRDGFPVAVTQNGIYSGNAQSGNYWFKPVFFGHTFQPESTLVSVTQPVENINFVDTQTDTMRGRVGGGSCLYFLGEATLSIRGPDNCSTTEVTTTNGYYEIVLPALPNYTVEVTNIAHPDWALIRAGTLGRFDYLEEASLAEGALTLDFIFYAEPEFLVTGLPDLAGCNVPVLDQSDYHTLNISVIERYGANTCPADSGSVSINNDIALISTPFDTTLDSTAYLEYTFRVGEPNLDPGGEHPHQKLVQISAHTRGGSVDFYQWALITGHRPRQQTFVTISPELPLMILRDPPGDRSYSYLVNQASYSLTSSMSVLFDASINLYQELMVGVEFESGFLGFSTRTKFWGNLGHSLEIGGSLLNQSEHQIRVTATDEFSTSADDGVIGDKGDVFIGAAFSLLYAITDVLSVNENCEVEISQSIIYGPDSIATRYMYTADHIESVIIPKLRMLSHHTNDADSIQFYADQIEVWQQTLALNDELKENAVTYLGTHQFNGGGIAQRHSYTVEQTDSRFVDFNFYINSEVAHETGMSIAGVGFRSGIQIRARWNFGRSFKADFTTSNTAGFSLEDDNVGDSFQLQVKSDPVYGTPVFDVDGGESSCPWERGTVPRDGVFLTMNSYNQSGIDPQSPAVFSLSLINASPSGERRSYMLFDLPESNPDGAVLKINGISIKDLFPYSIDPDQSRTATLTVERGPLAYDYENLKMGIRPVCEEETVIADTAVFSVHFQNPCSPIVLSEPMDNWILNVFNNDSLQIIISGYDKNNLSDISLSASPSGTYNWTTAFTIQNAELPENNAIRYWDVHNLPDGKYDIRLVLNCTSGTGYSELVSGTIDRQPPQPFGELQPADGILNTGDEISITFNEPVDCQYVGTDSILLTDMNDGTIIPVEISCSGNKLIVSPQISDNEIENRLLLFSLRGVADIYGNLIQDAISWSFRVNQNPVYWRPATINRNILLGEQDVFTVKLHNIGALPAQVSLIRSAAWVDVDLPVTSETIPSGGERLVTITINTSSLFVGAFYDTVWVNTPNGEEPLFLTANISVEPPPWNINPANFLNSMTMVTGIYIEDTPFCDENDLIAAFVDTSLRGIVSVQKIYPANEYVAFLIVYSDAVREDSVYFRVWDASEGKEYAISNTYTFVSDTAYGSTSDLDSLHVSGAVLQKISIPGTWFWISLGVEAENMSAHSVLRTVQASDGDLIKGHISYCQFVPGTGWVGNLDSIRIGAGFKIKTKRHTRLDFIGTPVSVVDRPIDISPGWNWIGYLPDLPIPLTDALNSVNLSDGDIIKSMFSFSEYNQEQWQGNLDYMYPGIGYMLNCANSSVLTYPQAEGKHIIHSTYLSAPNLVNQAPNWSVNPNSFENTMNITGQVLIGGVHILNANTLLGAFVDNNCRGIGKPIRIHDSWLFFMTVYATDSNELVWFQVWDPIKNKIEDMQQTMIFRADSIIGSPGRPFQWTTGIPTGITDGNKIIPDEFSLGQNYPNPFNPVTEIKYALKQPEHVHLVVYDALGRVVQVLVNEKQKAGYYSVQFDNQGLASGVYFYKITAGKFENTRKMILMK